MNTASAAAVWEVGSAKTRKDLAGQCWLTVSAPVPLWLGWQLGGGYMESGGNTHNIVRASQDYSFLVRPCLSVLPNSEAAKLGLYSPETCMMS
jgi:hypothetical protein